MRALSVDVRIIAATNRNLEELVAAGKFREDLFYRLHVFVLELPSLRERSGDIIELANYLLQKHVSALGKGAKTLTAAAQEALVQYNWPGNIRELENAIECTVIRVDGTAIEKDDLPAKIAATAKVVTNLHNRNPAAPPDEAERQAIIHALQLFGTTVSGKKQAAAHLGIGIATLYRRMSKHNL
jgi:transcriptional regulator with PAS, ATPase and Fis domain